MGGTPRGMTTPLLSLTAMLAAMTPMQRDNAEVVLLMNAIGAVESGLDYKAKGDDGKAVGAWQMHPAAWITANQWRERQGLDPIPRRRWDVPDNQRQIAKAYIMWLKARLFDEGLTKPTAEQVYLCFSMGYSGSKAIGHAVAKAPKAKAEAAERVGNIYRELIK